MSVQAPAQEARGWAIWRASVNSVALALTSAVAGGTLVAISWRFGTRGPLVLLALALAPFLGLLIAADMRVGAVLLLAVLPLNSLVPEVAALPPPLSIPLQLLEVALIFVAVAVALIRIGRGLVPLRWSPTLWTALAIVAWSLISLQSAADIDAGLKQVLSFVGGLALITVFLAVIHSEADLRLLTATFVAVGSAAALFAIATGGPTQSQFGGAVISGRLEGLFDQPNQLGSFCALVLFLGVAFGLGGRTRSTRVLGWVGAGALTAGLLLSLSRGAWIGTGLAGLYLVFALPQARKILISFLIPFVVAVMVLGPSLSSTPQVKVVSDRLAAFTAENPYDNRPTIYREARRQIVTEPVFGYGPGSFPLTSARATTERTTVTADHAHNIWLTWGAEMGLPAALLIVILMAGLGLVGHRVRKAARREGDLRHEAFVAGIVASLITVVGQGFVDYTWRNQAIFFAICGVVALLLASKRSDPS